MPRSSSLLLLLAALGAALAGAPEAGSAREAFAEGAQRVLQQVKSSAANGGTVADYICDQPDLQTLCRVIDAAGVGNGARALESATSIQTVFAPTDEAFTKDASGAARQLSLKTFDDIYTTPKAADQLLQNLILPGQAVLSTAFRNGQKYNTLLKGQSLKYSTAIFTSQVYVESSKQKAEIVKKDLRVGQSVIHKVNRVPYPDL